MKHIFNKEQCQKATFILESPLAKLSELYSSEIKDLAVVWCYYSGRIEGNTYTYVETEALLKDGITSEKKYEDAKMLKNLYNTFISELEYIHQEKNKEIIDECTLFRLHQSISTGLVSNEESGFLRTRAVRISGIDGNKRTSRMIESVVMMNADIIPVYSAKDADILNYRKGLIRFYETGDYTKYSDYFLNRQLERIKEIDI